MIFGVVKKVFWLLLIGSIVVAITRGAGGTPSDWGAWLSEQHAKVNVWIDDLGETVTETLPDPGDGSSETTPDNPADDNSGDIDSGDGSSNSESPGSTRTS